MSTYHTKDQYNAICDRCGEKRKSNELRKEWTGFIVCIDGCWEARHPQDFLRAKKDDQSVPWTRPEGDDVETDTSGWASTTTDVPAGTFDQSL